MFPAVTAFVPAKTAVSRVQQTTALGNDLFFLQQNIQIVRFFMKDLPLNRDPFLMIHGLAHIPFVKEDLHPDDLHLFVSAPIIRRVKIVRRTGAAHIVAGAFPAIAEEFFHIHKTGNKFFRRDRLFNNFRPIIHHHSAPLKRISVK